jgi:hypothetical protein
MQQKTFLIVQGHTNQNQPFRPSDWADRIVDLHSVFSSESSPCKGLVYISSVQGTRCLKIDRDLETRNPQYWKYIVDFAKDHDLRTQLTPETVASKKEIVIEKARCLYHAWIEKLSAAVVRTHKENPNAN